MQIRRRPGGVVQEDAAHAGRECDGRAAATQPRPGPFAHTQGAHSVNVELDLATGERGSRQRASGQLFARLCGAEAAMVVNNNAAAVMLVLAALAHGDRCPSVAARASRSAAASASPEVLEQSGAVLVDVGTTNRTRLSDYRRAVGR
jgi:L-seryl-tRNA(Ser) seleniumtransferase